jgi:hypothetical protein
MSRARQLADSADLSFDGTTLVVDETNNRVGIGTASPVYKVDVQQSSAGSAIRIWDNTDTSPNPTLYLQRGTNTTWGGDGFVDFKVDCASGNLAIHGGESGTTTKHIEVQGNGTFKFNSGYGSVATAYGCRAWVNFNGTGTVAMRGSGNVSSITDHATGQYSLNFTTSMPDASYSVIGSTIGSTGNWAYTIRTNNSSLSTSAARFSTGFSNADELYDITFVSIAVFR